MPSSDALQDYGPLEVGLDALIGVVQALPPDAWVARKDPESDRTVKIRETSPDFPQKEIETVLSAARSRYLGPGYANRIVLSCVPSGEQILPHRDDFGDHVRAHSFHCHIPLITHRDAVMGIGGGEHHLKRGRLYRMDEAQTHYVRNDSAVDRVHLLFAHWWTKET